MHVSHLVLSCVCGVLQRAPVAFLYRCFDAGMARMVRAHGDHFFPDGDDGGCVGAPCPARSPTRLLTVTLVAVPLSVLVLHRSSPAHR